MTNSDNTGILVGLARLRGDLPVLNERRCVGCTWCVEACPTMCLAMDGPMPWLPFPLQCIGCGVCEGVCPADAIEMAAPT